MTARLTFLLAATGLFFALGHADPGAQEARRDPERLFKAHKRRYDKNLDGRISRDEFERSARAFRRLDLDRDGFLTLADFEARAGGDAEEARTRAPAMAPDAEALEFFETRVRPVLAGSCYSCHSGGAKRVRGELLVDSREALLQGGFSGPAIVPGDPGASLLIEAVRYDDADFAMPPREKLRDDQIADLERWVSLGAPWPDEARGDLPEASPERGLDRDIDLEAGREFWSFQPVRRPEPPTPGGAEWARSDVDLFLLEAMEKAGVEPVGDASDRTWLRRVTFDLTGLPPSPEELAAYLGDRSGDRDARVVDRLLASRAYAERWGRHWLDVARYAESSGQESNVFYPHAWRYRDWVLRSFEEDLPYDRFLAQQIAGDLLPATDDDEAAWNLIATGYLALGSKNHNNRDAVRFELDVIDEQIDAFSQGMLGLTLACARCHDHKFDPVPIEDYYGLAGIFYSSETYFGTRGSLANKRPSGLLPLPASADVPNGPEMNAFLRSVLERSLDRAAGAMETGSMRMEQEPLDEEALRRLRRRARNDQEGLLEELLARFDERGRALPANRLAMGMGEGTPRDIAVLERGELDRPGEVVPRRMPRVLSDPEAAPITAGSGRLELARWIASEENPLTARVWVNRVWLHLFGAGIVATPDNFGSAGSRPSHPELLDWLAAEFVAGGWSTKSLVRTLALSRAYRLDSSPHARNEAKDPGVRLLWRMPERRLESEALRDAMLAVAGVLRHEPPVASPTGALEGRVRDGGLTELLNLESPVRSVYLPGLRGHTANMLEAFDAPDSAFVTGDRDETVVATQALFLMNDADVLRLADAFARRLLAAEEGDRARVDLAFELALGRPPESPERRAVLGFLSSYGEAFEETPRTTGEGQGDDRRSRRRRRRGGRLTDPRRTSLEAPADPRLAAWSAFAQSLFLCAEFRAVG